MITSEVKYLGDLRTESIHLQSGDKIVTDAPKDNMGKGEAFSPTDLLSTSLACCMLSIMGIASRTHNINIEGTEAKVTKIMASNPRRVNEIQIVVSMSKGNYSEKEKAILENAARTCPVALSLHPDIKQDLKFIWP